MKLRPIFLVLCLLPLAAEATRRLPLDVFDRALLCSSRLAAKLTIPRDEQLRNYAGKEDPTKVGLRRLQLWRDFSSRSSPYEEVPFALAMSSKLNTYLRDLGPVEMFPVSLENGPPAQFHSGTSNTYPKLFLNIAYYDEDPNLVFAQAIWKMWVVRQFRNSYRHEYSALNILKDALLRSSTPDWEKWKERLGKAYPSPIKLVEENGFVPADFAETKLVDIASEILSRIAAFQFYKEKTAIGMAEGEWFKSEFWEKAMHAQNQGGNQFFEWFMRSVAERFNVNPSDVEFIAKALNQSGLREAWEFSDLNPRLGYPSPKVRVTDPNGSVHEIMFNRVGFGWWVKETVYCTILKSHRASETCEQRIVHRELNPLANLNSRFQMMPMNNGELSVTVYLKVTMEMSNGRLDHFKWSPLSLQTAGRKEAEGKIPATAAYGSGRHPKQPNAEIDELLIKLRGNQ